MPTLRLILGDQLNLNISSLTDYQADDIVLLCEIKNEALYVKHHKKKIAFLFSAMRHFKALLTKKKFNVRYVKLDDKNNTGSFTGEVSRAVKKYKINHIIVTEPGEWRVYQELKSWPKKLAIKVTIREDNRFLCSIHEFKQWAQERKNLRMEFFYRQLRIKHNILMSENKKPLGGKWNFDSDNRSPPKTGMPIVKRYTQKPDLITQEVLKLVEQHFPDHFGDLQPFHFAVTQQQAKKALEHFITECLPLFGTYQDAMVNNEPWLYHSLISFYLNCGLLLPLDCIKAAEQAHQCNKAPLNAVEGFIRQVLGWREYIRGIYWHQMPGYDKKNFFNAKRKLPSFYWDGNTKMHCLSECVKQTKAHAYAHHIQRLMVLGNFALLTGISPQAVNEWFLVVYADAYEWVELPNVTGMALFADGGLLASKPYASGGAYINKMSDYCQYCAYKVKEKHGENACPFNYLYWHFLITHQDKLANNQRLAMVYNLLKKMSPNKIKAIKQDASLFLKKLN